MTRMMSDVMVKIPYELFKEMEDELNMLRREQQNFKQLLKYLYIKNDENIEETVRYKYSDLHLKSFDIDVDVVDFITGSNLRQEAEMKKEETAATESSNEQTKL